MCKKAIFTVAAIALGLLVLGQTRLGHKVFGLAELAWSKIGCKVNNSVPLDWEISRIEKEIAKLEKEKAKHFDKLAQEVVAVEKMKRDVGNVRAELEKQKANLVQMRQDLNAKTEHIVYNGHAFPRSRVEVKFSQDWKSYQVAEKGLEVKEKMLKQKQEYVEAYKAKIDTIKTTCDSLRTEVARLRTELEEVRVSQNQCKVQIDDSRLGEIKKSLAEVQERVDVMKKKAELQGHFSNSNVTIPVETKVEANKALEEFDSRFGDTKVSSEDK
jgi:chromosome segregation ATPase